MFITKGDAPDHRNVRSRRWSTTGRTGGSMSTHLQRIMRDERGLTTAEYAIGTVAVAGLGGVLLKLLTSDLVRDLLWNVIKNALSAFFG
jgi:Flp pilus assembly pilin Flp